jgi:hypothetical protein
MDAEAAREFFRKYQKMIEDLWLEREAFRRLILDAGAISEHQLEELAEGAKNNPDNRKLAAQNFASSRKALAEFGLEDMIRNLSSKLSTTDKQN